MGRNQEMNALSVARKVTGLTSAVAEGAIDGDHLVLRTAADGNIHRTVGAGAVTRETHEWKMTVTVQDLHQEEVTTTESGKDVDIAIAVPNRAHLDTTAAHVNLERASASTAERKVTSESTALVQVAVVPPEEEETDLEKHVSAASASTIVEACIIVHVRITVVRTNKVGLLPMIAQIGEWKVVAMENASTRGDKAVAEAAAWVAVSVQRRVVTEGGETTVQRPLVVDHHQQTAKLNAAKTILSETAPPQQQEGTIKKCDDEMKLDESFAWSCCVHQRTEPPLLC